MSDWRNFLDDVSDEISVAWNTFTHQPGEVMICFVNRYLEGLDGIKYKIKHKRGVVEAHTTPKKYCVTISPKSFDPIEIYVWSRMSNAYKKLDNVVPNVGSKKLVRKVLKTYKTHGKTELHPKNKPIAPPPEKPAPAPAAGPSPTSNQGVKPTPKKDESDLSQTHVERPVPDNITKEQLKKIFPAAKLDYLHQIADELNKDLLKFKLDTPIRRAHFFGQTRQETGPGVKGNAESFNYNADGLVRTFGYYKKNRNEAKEDGRQEHRVPGSKNIKMTRAAKEEVIANKVYGKEGAARALGNEKDDDGWRFRGRGLKQTTGRGNYDRLTKKHLEVWGEHIDFVSNPDLVATFPYTIRSAVAFWLTNKCWEAADKGINDTAIDAVTKIVNSGEIRNHNNGVYQIGRNPVTNRRNYTKLAYCTFT